MDDKFLIFKINNTFYSLSINSIQEIIKNEGELHKIPRSENYHVGILNVRGNVTNIININKLFQIEDKNQKKYIILLDNGTKKGLLVDDVVGIKSSETLRKHESQIVNNEYMQNVLVDDDTKDIYINLDCGKMATI